MRLHMHDLCIDSGKRIPMDNGQPIGLAGAVFDKRCEGLIKV